MTEHHLVPCQVCGTAMSLHKENPPPRPPGKPWYYVDGRHDVDCPFNIHFRPARYPTPDAAVNEWNGRPIK